MLPCGLGIVSTCCIFELSRFYPCGETLQSRLLYTIGGKGGRTGKIGHAMRKRALVSRTEDKLAAELEEIAGVALGQFDRCLVNSARALLRSVPVIVTQRPSLPLYAPPPTSCC
jgi:hypothetical protein